MDEHNPPALVKRIFSWMINHPIISLVLLVLVITFTIKLIDYSLSRYACYTQWVDSSIESKYTLRGGCLVKYNNDWIPAKNFRVN